MKVARHRTPLAIVIIALGAIGFHNGTHAAAAAPGGPNVLKFSPNLTRSAVLARPDTDLVEFSDGKRMRVGELRKLDAAAQRMRAAKPTRSLPPGLKTPPAATGRLVQNRADLAAALRHPGNETLQLPLGRLVTADQLRFVQPEVEKRLGRRLSDAAPQPRRDGPAIKVNAQTDWREMLKRPDSTILESPSGKRVTVGEIKQSIAKSRERAAPENLRGGRP
jgi:hypothetical protein